jgi:hypothetical protein
VLQANKQCDKNSLDKWFIFSLPKLLILDGRVGCEIPFPHCQPELASSVVGETVISHPSLLDGNCASRVVGDVFALQNDFLWRYFACLDVNTLLQSSHVNVVCFVDTAFSLEWFHFNLGTLSLTLNSKV